MGLLSRQKAQQKDLSAKSKKLHNSNTLITPPHIRSALHKRCIVMTSSLRSGRGGAQGASRGRGRGRAAAQPAPMSSEEDSGLAGLG
eukprot:467400-Pelagomonas_calceolata.AAC.1